MTQYNLYYCAKKEGRFRTPTIRNWDRIFSKGSSEPNKDQSNLNAGGGGAPQDFELELLVH